MNPGIGTGTPAQRSVLGRWVRSSIGAKWVMAITGLLFLVWLVLHLGGNLMVFGGQAKFNEYALLLRKEPLLLWGMRIGLIVVVVLHILAGIRLSALNRQARGPQGYQGYRYRKASLFSRTMIYSGLLVLAFIVFHLLHLTFGAILPANFALRDPAGNHDVFGMLVSGFKNPLVVVIYVVSVILVGSHLAHGIWSSVQTLGLSGTRWTPFALKASKVLAALLALGFISIPIAVAVGIINLP